MIQEIQGFRNKRYRALDIENTWLKWEIQDLTWNRPFLVYTISNARTKHTVPVFPSTYIAIVATNSILTQNLLIFLLRILYKVLKWLLPKVRVIDPDQWQNDADQIRFGAEILSLTMKNCTSIQEEYELYIQAFLFRRN